MPPIKRPEKRILRADCSDSDVVQKRGLFRPLFPLFNAYCYFSSPFTAPGELEAVERMEKKLGFHGLRTSSDSGGGATSVRGS